MLFCTPAVLGGPFAVLVAYEALPLPGLVHWQLLFGSVGDPTH